MTWQWKSGYFFGLIVFFLVPESAFAQPYICGQICLDVCECMRC